jgi:hypothetical protein
MYTNQSTTVTMVQGTLQMNHDYEYNAQSIQIYPQYPYQL